MRTEQSNLFLPCSIAKSHELWIVRRFLGVSFVFALFEREVLLPLKANVFLVGCTIRLVHSDFPWSVLRGISAWMEIMRASLGEKIGQGQLIEWYFLIWTLDRFTGVAWMDLRFRLKQWTVTSEKNVYALLGKRWRYQIIQSTKLDDMIKIVNDYM